jgi:hypothetical protein
MLKGMLLTGLLLSLLAGVAAARTSATAIGPRLGFSADPDQLVLGGQMTIGDVAPSLTFDPNLEFGVGDHQTIVALNMDGHYHLSLRDSDWMPYVGGGVGVNFVSVDEPAPFKDESSTEVGLNLILGTEVPTRSGSRFFSELKLGLGDIPSLKILAGWNFAMR